MFAISLHFPGNRYHATPWGRNVNEADVAWPPEPWRILRALIAIWWRKGNRERWTEDDLAELIDSLAEQLPIYKLPEGAVHTHTRHYMPAPVKTTLIFDAFACLPANAEMVIAWPEVTLPEPLFAFAADLANAIGYLGRAESWADCTALAEWDVSAANCLFEGADKAGGDPVRLIAPRTPADYTAERNRLLAAFEENQCQRAKAEGKKMPTLKALEAARKKEFGPTLPERLVDALTLDTGDYQDFGWSRPPASRELIYLRPPLAPTSRQPRRRASTADDPARFTVARFVLAGRPRPRIEDAVKIGELMRLAALAQFGWARDEATGRRRPKAPPVISGRDAENRPLRDPAHRHAFWLSEDADGDGHIDHVVIYAQEGFCSEVRRKLDRLTKLWIEPDKRIGGDDKTEGGEARQEWRLALEGFGKPEDFRDASRLLGTSRIWRSVTPFLATGHLKAGGYEAEIRRLAVRRHLPEVTGVEPLRAKLAEEGSENAAAGGQIGIMIHGRLRRAIHFRRFRSAGNERQPDPAGTFVQLRFAEEVEGPIALGYACHFGLGSFSANAESEVDLY